MKSKVLLVAACVMLVAAGTFAQSARQDVKWARKSPTAITVDGVLNEAGWAVAESVNVVYGQSAGMPGSGWYDESPAPRVPSDPTRATVKFLTFNDTLYVAFIIKDSSVGGGPFNKFDGILTNLRYKQATGFQGTPGRDWNTSAAAEIFYGWVKEDWADTLADRRGRMPAHLGFFGSSPYSPRPDSLNTRYWYAATTVQGVQNSDTTIDQGYTIELKINTRTFGYNITQAAGDIMMYSFSIYDADWQWPLQVNRFTGNRVWYQGPWGNTSAYGHVRIYARPDVTTTSGAVPTIPPELNIPNAAPSTSTPVIDGLLNDAVWSHPNIGTLQIQYGSNSIRNAYPSTAPYRSGQFQPAVNGGTAAVQDPNLATVKYFFKGDTLFLGFNVNDRVVQFFDSTTVDRWDGFRVTISDRGALNPDNVLWPRQLSFIVAGSGTNGVALRRDDLALQSGAWDSAGTKVQVALRLKGGTTIDTLGATADSGYTAEMRINLRALGYPAGRGDGALFFGITHFDGDSFNPPTTSYGTRTWFMREEAFHDGPIWAYLNPNVYTGVGDNTSNGLPTDFALLGNYPNPFNPSTTIRFSLPQTSVVTLEVFDILGRLVASQSLGLREPGVQTHVFMADNLASGVYNYRLRMASNHATVAGKMVLLK